jgi:iron complex outermembrane receptor protein
MKMSKRITLFTRVLKLMLIITVALVWGTAIAQEKDKKAADEFTLEEITVTAQFQETNLQKTPISITAMTGETLEEQKILNVKDLGLVIPNANIRQMGNLSGPNAQIFLRGVGYGDFIPAIEPGVGVYVDDVYVETLVSSMMDLVDIERIEVLRGPQGTLSGKNNLGGSIKIISKTPLGDNTGHLQVTYGDYNRVDFNAGYDFSVIEDKLFARFSASSRSIDGYMDVLDFTCQMRANGTPELAGSLPSQIRTNKSSRGNCKIGEKGGRESDAGKLVLRWLPTDRLEFNIGIDYTKAAADPSAATQLKGLSSDPMQINNFLFNNAFFNTYVDPVLNVNPGDQFTMFGDVFVTGSPFKVYESYYDPLFAQPGYQLHWPRKTDEEYKNWFAKADYDISEDMHLKFIYGHREYQQVFATTNDTPLSNNAYLVDQEHDQDSFEARLTGNSFNNRLDWTVGAYYFESDHWYGGNVTLGAYGSGTWMFENNDTQQVESQSAFAHGIFSITDKLSATAGIRFTKDDKTSTVDHTDFVTVPAPYNFTDDYSDWKLSLDYQFTDDIMVYTQVATGYSSKGTVARPWNPSQLDAITNEELISYEIGAKTDFFNNRLRVKIPPPEAVA